MVSVSRCWPAPAPSLIFGRSGALSGAGRALDVLLADQRLRADGAGRAAAERREAGLGDLEGDRRLLLRRHVERLDPADDRAGDLDVLALHHVGGVVEDRPHLVARAAVVARADAEHQQRRQAESEQADDRDAPHGPGGTVVGSQSRVPLVSRHGFEPSGARLRRAAGAALLLAELHAVEAGERGRRRQDRPEAGNVGLLERVEDRRDARVVAVGVVSSRRPGRTW